MYDVNILNRKIIYLRLFIKAWSGVRTKKKRESNLRQPWQRRGRRFPSLRADPTMHLPRSSQGRSINLITHMQLNKQLMLRPQQIHHYWLPRTEVTEHIRAYGERFHLHFCTTSTSYLFLCASSFHFGNWKAKLPVRVLQEICV